MSALDDTPVRNPEVIITRDRSSGRLHKRYLLESGETATLEGCNLDQAGAYDVVPWDVVERAEPEDLCLRCFPVGG